MRKMLAHVTDRGICYDGSQLRPLFAFQKLGLRGNSIVAFYGSANVDAAHMIDAEDIENEEFITSDEMLHFIVEIFDTPVDLVKAVMWQRILVRIAASYIDDVFDIRTVLNGDDIMLPSSPSSGDLKASVSIATVSPVSLLIHLGINVKDGGFPEGVNAGWLNLTPEHAAGIAEEFAAEFGDVCKQIDKVKPVV